MAKSWAARLRRFACRRTFCCSGTYKKCLTKVLRNLGNKDFNYSYDANRVYYRDSLMLGVDVASFICGYDYVDSISFAINPTFSLTQFFESGIG
ncbi:MAG: hypothetical protein K6A32_01135, partial [Bacteroidales bacterium]|nr:hypothetical protein [Bacteroidales bacterium]